MATKKQQWFQYKYGCNYHLNIRDVFSNRVLPSNICRINPLLPRLSVLIKFLFCKAKTVAELNLSKLLPWA